MSTKTVARSIVGSLRIVGVSAAVAAGIAGFAPIQTDVATTDVAVVAQRTGLPAKACAQLLDHAPGHVAVKHGCIVIPDSGEIGGAPLFS